MCRPATSDRVIVTVIICLLIVVFSYTQCRRAECREECVEKGYKHSYANHDGCKCLEEADE
jgi:hypothetical protein